jgi:flagellar biosynthesis/type III secretory pathway chaperone
MATPDRAGPAGALLDLLDRERTAALDGRFDRLERLVAEKARLLDRLARHGAPEEALAALRAAGRRNEALLGAMADGVRRAQDRLRAIAERKDFSTYGAGGERVAPAAAGRSLRRKA